MPRPIAVPIRRAMLRRWQRGQSAVRLAESFGLAPRTVRHLVRRFQRQGEAALAPSYHPPRPAKAKTQQLMQAVLHLRQQHPTWGAGLIRVWLRQQSPQRCLPVERTMQRWFQHAGLSPAPRGRRPSSAAQRASRPHEVWQMDAKEQVKLGSGSRVSWLRIADECSGAVLYSAVFPPGRLEPGVARRGAVAIAAGVSAVGAAATASGGQRRALGFLG